MCIACERSLHALDATRNWQGVLRAAGRDLRFHANGIGGLPQTFTIQSGLFTGKTIRAYEQGYIIETHSDGMISLTLAPDGQEMLLAYAPGTNRTQVVQIADAPSAVHPMGDKAYQVNLSITS